MFSKATLRSQQGFPGYDQLTALDKCSQTSRVLVSSSQLLLQAIITLIFWAKGSSGLSIWESSNDYFITRALRLWS